MAKIRVAFKVWFETEGKYIFGEGALKLLEEISKFNSLSRAADAVSMSYRYAWGLLNTIEKSMGAQVLTTHRGGKHGGGRSELTERGKSLVESYRKIKEDFEDLANRHSKHLESYTR